MLIVFGGLPGVGKSAIARELARVLGAVHVRVDSIEHALRPVVEDMDDWGYKVAYAVAEDNLRAGLTVIADTVNPIDLTRRAWRDVGRRADVRVFQVHVVCSDEGEHRRRVETRAPDIVGFGLPLWTDVLGRDFEPWPDADLIVDTTATQIVDSVEMVRDAVTGSQGAA
jgi:predicted kinase